MTFNRSICHYACAIGPDLALVVDLCSPHSDARETTGDIWDAYACDGDGNLVFRVATVQAIHPFESFVPTWTRLAEERMKAWQAGNTFGCNWTEWPSLENTSKPDYDGPRPNWDEQLINWIGWDR